MKNKYVERLWNGLIKENPTFVLMLGMCPTLAVTGSAINGLGMGISTAVVLIASNLLISLLKNIIPDRVRIPSYIVIVASLVTIVELLIKAYLPSLNEALGVYIPLIVVNCIILGRAESYASKNKPLLSVMDGIGMGLGFALALTCIGAVREILGSGQIFGVNLTAIAAAMTATFERIPMPWWLVEITSIVTFPILPMPQFYVRLISGLVNLLAQRLEVITVFKLAPGAFFVLAILTALQNKFKAPSATNGSVFQSKLACGGDCTHCSGSACMSNHEILETRRKQALEESLEAKKADLAKTQEEFDASLGKKE